MTALPLVRFPFELLPYRDSIARKMFATAKGSQSIAGTTQRAASSTGKWAFRMERIPLVDKATILLWRQVESLLEGELNQVLVPVCDADRTPLPRGYSEELPHGDDALFDDGTGYAQTNYVAKVNAAALLAATEIQLRIENGEQPIAGQRFSVGVRLYEISQVIDLVGAVATVRVWPQLRQSMAINQDAIFESPVCLCRLMSDDAMAAEIFGANKWSQGDLTFIEDTGPLN